MERHDFIRRLELAVFNEISSLAHRDGQLDAQVPVDGDAFAAQEHSRQVEALRQIGLRGAWWNQG